MMESFLFLIEECRFNYLGNGNLLKKYFFCCIVWNVSEERVGGDFLWDYWNGMRIWGRRVVMENEEEEEWVKGIL